MMALIILMLLPALGYASFSVDIQAAPTRNQSFATDVGEDSSVITDQELAAYRITDSFLKKAAGLYSGGTPSDVFVKSPTPWGDLYKTYNWSEVKRETKVKNITMYLFNAKKVTLAKEKFTNFGSKDANFTSSIKAVNVNNSIVKLFSGTVAAVDVKYNVDLIVQNNPEIKRNFKFESPFGERTHRAMVNETKLVKPSEVTMLLKPNQTAEVVFNATYVILGVYFHYETRLNGHLAVNYNPRYKGHHFWAYDIKEVMKAGGMPVVRTAIDWITVRFYSDFNVIAFDSQKGNVIVSREAQYTD